MRENIIYLTIFLLVAATLTTFAAAESESGSTDEISPEDLQAFVEDAAAYAEENGKEAALEEFNNKEGEFVDGQLYIFANDLDGVNLAHPMKPDLVGKSQTDLQDVNGVYFIRNMNAIAETAGSGFTYYIFANPAHDNEEELKLVFVKKIDDDWYIGSGIYLT